jgi:hypothetical protein
MLPLSLRQCLCQGLGAALHNTAAGPFSLGDSAVAWEIFVGDTPQYDAVQSANIAGAAISLALIDVLVAQQILTE